jgi:4-amino-4-deoxy-L-arabinose transferase-like glycosyltransferase
MPIIQDTIHKLEVAGGMRYLKIGLSVLVVLGAAALYNFRSYHNMATQEAMDAAQLARNIARGKGYTTDFIRPFSMYLLKKNNEHEMTDARLNELTMVKGAHPDIANPPVYPVVLAGLMKVVHFDFSMPLTKGFWGSGGIFLRAQPDFIISAFNQVLFLICVVLLFFLARRLFDPMTAWISAGVFFGTELFWRFSVSGLSTILLLLIFLGLAWTLVLIEEQCREPRWGVVRLVLLAIAAGLLTGLGCLTRYSFGWLIIPLIAFLLLFGGARKAVLVPVAFVAFSMAVAPWIVRNYRVSDTPFGTAGYAVYQDSGLFPEDLLECSLEPELRRGRINAVTQKLLVNIRQILQEHAPRLAGTWLSAFFIVGLMAGFANPSASRLRYFVLLSLLVLVFVQALGRTYLSSDSPEVNSENLLVLLAPLALVFAVSFFLLLLNQVYLPMRELRYVVIGLFCLAGCLPMLFTFLPPRHWPLAGPPYRPHTAHVIGEWIKEKELTASDIPWAVAWYGQRQCLWLPRDRAEFEEINNFYRTISLVYLTERSSQRFGSWGSIVILETLNNRPPPDFPLQKVPPTRTENPADLQGAQVIITDIDRWR